MLQFHRTVDTDDSDETTENENELANSQQHSTRQVEEWMMICQHHLQMSEHSEDSSSEQLDLCQAARAYPNLEEMPSFITHHKQLPFSKTTHKQIHNCFKVNNFEHILPYNSISMPV